MTDYVDTRIPRGYVVVSPQHLAWIRALYYAGGCNERSDTVAVDSDAFARDYAQRYLGGSEVTLHQLYEHHLAAQRRDTEAVIAP